MCLLNLCRRFSWYGRCVFGRCIVLLLSFLLRFAYVAFLPLQASEVTTCFEFMSLTQRTFSTELSLISQKGVTVYHTNAALV